MINVLCNDGNCATNIKGSLGEICAELSIISREIRKTIKEKGDDDDLLVFDMYLRELFPEIVIADESKIEELFTKAIKEIIGEDMEDSK